MSEYNKFEAGKLTVNKPDPNDKKSSSSSQKISDAKKETQRKIEDTLNRNKK